MFGEREGTGIRTGLRHPTRADGARESLADGPPDRMFGQHFKNKVAVLYPGNLPERGQDGARMGGAKVLLGALLRLIILSRIQSRGPSKQKWVRG